MSIEFAGELIRITGAGRIEDAEKLTGLLQAKPGRMVDLSEAVTLHTAIVQVLLAFHPPLPGSAGDAFVNRWLLPQLKKSLLLDPQSRSETLSETT